MLSLSVVTVTVAPAGDAVEGQIDPAAGGGNGLDADGVLAVSPVVLHLHAPRDHRGHGVVVGPDIHAHPAARRDLLGNGGIHGIAAVEGVVGNDLGSRRSGPAGQQAEELHGSQQPYPSAMRVYIPMGMALISSAIPAVSAAAQASSRVSSGAVMTILE